MWRPKAAVTDLCPYVSDISTETHDILTYFLGDVRQGLGFQVLGHDDSAALLRGVIFDWDAFIENVKCGFVIRPGVSEVCKILQHLVLNELHRRIVHVDLILGCCRV